LKDIEGPEVTASKKKPVKERKKKKTKERDPILPGEEKLDNEPDETEQTLKRDIEENKKPKKEIVNNPKDAFKPHKSVDPFKPQTTVGEEAQAHAKHRNKQTENKSGNKDGTGKPDLSSSVSDTLPQKLSGRAKAPDMVERQPAPQRQELLVQGQRSLQLLDSVTSAGEREGRRGKKKPGQREQREMASLAIPGLHAPPDAGTFSGGSFSTNSPLGQSHGKGSPGPGRGRGRGRGELRPEVARGSGEQRPKEVASGRGEQRPKEVARGRGQQRPREVAGGRGELRRGEVGRGRGKPRPKEDDGELEEAVWRSEMLAGKEKRQAEDRRRRANYAKYRHQQDAAAGALPNVVPVRDWSPVPAGYQLRVPQPGT
jgi:hypothetical protein